MISLAIISVGAMGYVTSQISSLKNTSLSISRTMATLLIYDMTARMQANSAEFWKGNGTPTTPTSGYLPAGGTPTANPNCYNTLKGLYCTSNQMALNDVSEWNTLVTKAFPSGSVRALICLDGGVVAVVPTTTPACAATNTSYPLTYSIKIFWQSVPGSGSYDQVQMGTVEAPVLRAPTYPLPAPLPNQ